jgi:FkbM family methyltransferase
VEVTFLDLGANIGYFSVIAAALVKDNGKVHAFEPMPQNLTQESSYSSKLVQYASTKSSASHSQTRRPHSEGVDEYSEFPAANRRLPAGMAPCCLQAHGLAQG